MRSAQDQERSDYDDDDDDDGWRVGSNAPILLSDHSDEKSRCFQADL